MASLVEHARGTARRVRDGAIVAFERRRGLDTFEQVDLASLGVADDHRVHYQPSGWLDLRRTLRRREVSRHDVFLDLGSGKGRVLLSAAGYPFARVIGVEISLALNEVAARNVAASRGRQRCGAVELVTADVMTYRVPDDVTVAYVYNAFHGPVFQAALDALIASADRAPRSLHLIYRNALEHERILRTGRFRVVRTAPGLRPGREWSRQTAIRVYELTDARPR